MKKKTLYLVIGLICLSSLGIVAVQLFWIRNAYEVKEAQFKRSVNDALGMAVNKMEAHENMAFLSRNYREDSIRILLQSFVDDTLKDWQKRVELLTGGSRSLPAVPQPPALSGSSAGKKDNKAAKATDKRDRHGSSVRENYNAYLYQESLQHFLEEMKKQEEMLADTFYYELPLPEENMEYRVIIRDYSVNVQPEVFFEPDYNVISSPGWQVAPPLPMPPPPPAEATIREQLKKLNQKTKKVQDVIRRIAIEMETQPRGIRNRIDRNGLYSLLQESFADKDIDLPFEFAVLSPGNDTLPIPLKTENFKPGFLGTEHRVSLFPYDIVQKPDLLLVYFPGEKSSVLKSISWMLAGSAFFILFILLTSGLSIVFMIRQKKISDIKTDFINNMTHEFKTPIATISIAADSISNPKVLAEPDLIRNYTRIIKEENSRMNARVEQVLQMALLDSKDFRLEKTELDLHEVIRKIVKNIRILVDRQEGRLETDLAASQTKVEADESHLTNVFLAVFDNAIKYSQGKPEIRVSTVNSGGTVITAIEDTGIGMTPEVSRKIFDKFYRVASGNIHNVKGFGLGLSYAKAIVMAHGGEITVRSEPGKGSRFEIVLPVKLQSATGGTSEGEINYEI
jgi:signal transduction histidine kinase